MTNKCSVKKIPKPAASWDAYYLPFLIPVPRADITNGSQTLRAAKALRDQFIGCLLSRAGEVKTQSGNVLACGYTVPESEPSPI